MLRRGDQVLPRQSRRPVRLSPPDIYPGGQRVQEAERSARAFRRDLGIGYVRAGPDFAPFAEQYRGSAQHDSSHRVHGGEHAGPQARGQMAGSEYLRRAQAGARGNLESGRVERTRRPARTDGVAQTAGVASATGFSGAWRAGAAGVAGAAHPRRIPAQRGGPASAAVVRAVVATRARGSRKTPAPPSRHLNTETTTA